MAVCPTQIAVFFCALALRDGLPTDTFELTEEAIPEIGDGEALVRTEWISLDPTNRAWIAETPTYLPPVGIGEVMRGLGLGRVVASKHHGYQEGQLVTGADRLAGVGGGLRCGAAAPCTEIPGVSPSAYLGALGMTGLTAWVGLTDIGRPQAGRDGCRLGRRRRGGLGRRPDREVEGARVVGIAGGAEKCTLLIERLGFDAAVDHRAERLARPASRGHAGRDRR